VKVSEAHAAPRGGGRPAGILRGATGQPDAGHPWTPVKGKNWDFGEYFGWGFATFAHSSIYYFFEFLFFKIFIFKWDRNLSFFIFFIRRIYNATCATCVLRQLHSFKISVTFANYTFLNFKSVNCKFKFKSYKTIPKQRSKTSPNQLILRSKFTFATIIQISFKICNWNYNQMELSNFQYSQNLRFNNFYLTQKSVCTFYIFSQKVVAFF